MEKVISAMLVYSRCTFFVCRLSLVFTSKNYLQATVTVFDLHDGNTSSS